MMYFPVREIIIIVHRINHIHIRTTSIICTGDEGLYHLNRTESRTATRLRRVRNNLLSH
jgi:hypothetical protein